MTCERIFNNLFLDLCEFTVYCDLRETFKQTASVEATPLQGMDVQLL